MSDDDVDGLFPLYLGALGALSLYWLTIPKPKPPDLTGKKVVITGANSGIGKGLTEVCALAGGHVIMAVRDTRLGTSIKHDLVNKYNNKKLIIDVEELDLQSLDSIDSFVVSQSNVDILINNAAVLQPKQTIYAAKNHLVESTMLTNYVGPFYLTMKLLPNLINSAKLNNSYSHIINVSSKLERNANVTLSNYRSIFNAKNDDYSCWDAYANSKLLNILFTMELQKRLRPDSKVVVAAVTPGLVNTSLDRHMHSMQLTRYLTYPLKQIFLKSPENSALEIINLTGVTPRSDAGRDRDIIPYYSNLKAIKPGNAVFQEEKTNEKLAGEVFRYTMDLLGLKEE